VVTSVNGRSFIITEQSVRGLGRLMKDKEQWVIKKTEVILEIDQSEAFASAGYKNMLDLFRESAQYARQHALEYIGKVAEDGDRFAAIELGGNPIAEMAESDAYPEKEFVIDYIPKVGPRFDVKYITRMYRMDGTIVGVKVDSFV